MSSLPSRSRRRTVTCGGSFSGQLPSCLLAFCAWCGCKSNVRNPWRLWAEYAYALATRPNYPLPGNSATLHAEQVSLSSRECGKGSFASSKKTKKTKIEVALTLPLIVTANTGLLEFWRCVHRTLFSTSHGISDLRSVTLIYVPVFQQNLVGKLAFSNAQDLLGKSAAR